MFMFPTKEIHGHLIVHPLFEAVLLQWSEIGREALFKTITSQCVS